MLRKCTAKIVASYVERNATSVAQLPLIISSVYAALSSSVGKEPEQTEERVPVVPVRRSIRPDTLICLDCGFQGKILKRHLRTDHNLTPDEYRRRWDLPHDYPIVAPNYARQRSAFAKQIGFGRKPRTVTEPPSPLPARRARRGRPRNAETAAPAEST